VTLALGLVSLSVLVLVALVWYARREAVASTRLGYAERDRKVVLDVEEIKGKDRDRAATDALRDELLNARATRP